MKYCSVYYLYIIYFAKIYSKDRGYWSQYSLGKYQGTRDQAWAVRRTGFIYSSIAQFSVGHAKTLRPNATKQIESWLGNVVLNGNLQ